MGAGEQPDGLYSGVITSGDVALHGGPISAAARRLDGNRISGGQHVTFTLREMRRRRNHVGLADGNLVDCAGTAAEQARWSDPTVIHQERGLGFAVQKPDLVVDSKTAAAPPSATRAFAQGEAIEHDRVMLFQDLDRLGLRDPDARAAVG